MAKDSSEGKPVQTKVLLKPTAIGLLVMTRLARPHIDKSAELRRLIELGYAAERAGFILDGTTLRHGGRAWEAQPDLAPEVCTVAQHPSHQAVESRLAQKDDLSVTSQRASPLFSKNTHVSTPEVISDTEVAIIKPVGSSLRANLRGLSG